MHVPGVERFASGGPWEVRFGYSRAVRAGDLLLVAGTTAIEEDGVVRGIGDAGAQTAFVLDRIDAAPAAAGARMDQVVQTRMNITDASHAEEIGRAHEERYGKRPSASAMVAVAARGDRVRGHGGAIACEPQR